MNQYFYLDATQGNGFWTIHYTQNGQIYYYNMKTNESKWSEDFQKSYYSNYYVTI